MRKQLRNDLPNHHISGLYGAIHGPLECIVATLITQIRIGSMRKQYGKRFGKFILRSPH
jgi:hypothetical protein